MTPILSQRVSYIAGMFQTSATPARMDLFEDRLVITTVHKETGADVETVLDAPLSDITVSGSAALLTFKVGEIKRRVDFSFAARAVMVRPGGVLALPAILRDSGVYTWLDELRSRTVRVNYFSIGHTWAVALGVVAIIIVAVAVIGINNMGS